MGRRNASRMTYKAMCSVTYTFVCEQCGTHNGPFVSYLNTYTSTKANAGSLFKLDVAYDMDINEKAQQNAVSQLKKIKQLIQRNVAQGLIYKKISKEMLPIAEHFNRCLTHAASCAVCRAPQSWYPVPTNSLQLWMQAHKLKSIQYSGNPVIRFGKTTCALLGAFPDDMYEQETPVVLKQRRVFSAPKIHAASSGFVLLEGLTHPGLQQILKVGDMGHDVFYADEEVIEGTPLGFMMNACLTDGMFQDYLLQLCDVVDFLHQQTPPLAHGSIALHTVMVLPSQVVKLTGYDDVYVHATSKQDILALGEIVAAAPKHLRKKYRFIADKAQQGLYETVTAFQDDLMTAMKTSRKQVIAILFPVLALVVLVVRRFI